MNAVVEVISAGPGVSVQDLGRRGYLAQGLSAGGAMDKRALYEGAALLQRAPQSAIEMQGFGGIFCASQTVRIALTGAPMQAQIDGKTVAWNASHLLPADARLEVGGVVHGAIGYLHFGAGFDLPSVMGGLSAHFGAEIGVRVQPGMTLPLAEDPGARIGLALPLEDRFSGGTLHVVRSMQSHLFGEATLARFAATAFTRDLRANRQGIRLTPDGDGFAAEGGLSVVSEIITPGDIQITGDGAPYILMAESQTTGGYPRLATVLPSDLPRAAQLPVGADVRMVLLDRAEAIVYERRARADQAGLTKACRSLVRDPAEMTDLLSYNLTDGAMDARADPFDGER